MTTNSLHHQLSELSDAEIVRLAIWLFDEERIAQEDTLVGTTKNDLAQEEFFTGFNDFLASLDIEPIQNRPSPPAIANALRFALEFYAEQEPGRVRQEIKGLGTEAGEVELLQLITDGFPYIVILTVLTKSIDIHWKKIDENKKMTEFKLKVGSSGNVIGLLKSLVSKLTGSP